MAFSAKIVGDELVLQIPMNAKPEKSSSGKTLVVASTYGNKETDCVVDGKKVIVGVNAYISKKYAGGRLVVYRGAGIACCLGNEAASRQGPSLGKSDLRIPQISPFFRRLNREAGKVRETGHALGSRCPAMTKGRFRGFIASCEIASPQPSEPRVGSSSLSGRICRPAGPRAFFLAPQCF